MAGAPAPAPVTPPAPAAVPVLPSVVPGKPYTYAASTTDPRALQLPDGSGRVAAAWTNPAEVDLDVPGPAGGGPYQLALYCLDWANYAGGVTQSVSILDGASGAVLDTQTIGGFSTHPAYLRWVVEGQVKVRISRTAGGGAVVSGVFLDPVPAP